jgi:hypothetical protein
MTLPIPTELQKAIAASAGEPLRLIDPDTNSSYVLVPAYQYDRLVHPDDALRETYPAQEKMASDAGWDDPSLDEYNNYDQHRRETA